MRGTVTDVCSSCKNAPDARLCRSASRGEGGASSQTSGSSSARLPSSNADQSHAGGRSVRTCAVRLAACREGRRRSRSPAGSSWSAFPILALIALLVVGKVFHVVFLFLVAALIALLLDPLVRALERLRIPRGFSIAIVYLSFRGRAGRRRDRRSSVIVIDQTQSAANRIDDYLTTESGRPPQTGFERDVDRLQLWLDTHHLERVDIQRAGPRLRREASRARTSRSTRRR